LGFLAFSARDNGGFHYAGPGEPGVSPLDEELVLERIRLSAPQVDHLVVSLHWGIEYAPCPTPEQVALGRRMVEAGARVVAGHHPRILQGYERYRDGLICYSLGNLCHSDFEIVAADRTYAAKLRPCEKELGIFELSFSRSGIDGLKIVPLRLNERGQPDLCDAAQGAEIMRKLEERSEILAQGRLDKYWEELLVKKRVQGPLQEWWQRGSLLDKLKGFKLSQLQTLWVLTTDYCAARFSRKSSKWLLLNPNNDKKARPYCGKEGDDKF
jgi:poly-gamma-glutamate synthesis protein (capsule biosynthesis protein)